MKKILIATLIFLLAFICLGLAIFQFGLGNAWERIYRDLRQTGPNMTHLQLLNLVVMGLLMVSFAILGFFQAKKKRRNRFVWSSLCFVFNLWAFIILLLLPALNKEKTDRVSH
jgi:hypothetical protein